MEDANRLEALALLEKMNRKQIMLAIAYMKELSNAEDKKKNVQETKNVS